MMAEQKTYLGFKANLWALLVINALIVVALIWHFKSYQVDAEQEAMLNKPVAKKVEKPQPVKKDAQPKPPKIAETIKKVEALETKATKVLKTYSVVEGDSYASLAAKLGISSQELYQLNHGMPLDTGVLIMLPESSEPTKTTQAVKSVQSIQSTVKKATLNQSKSTIKKQLSTSLPVVESTTPTTQYHTVVKGDTLYSISKKYNLSTDDLVQLNSLKNQQVNIGQKLQVSQDLAQSDKSLKPQALTLEVAKITEQITGKPTEQAAQWHTVVKGDSLWGISQQYNISVDDLMQLNQLSSNQVNIGQKLQVK